MNTCKICGHETREAFDHEIRKKYSAKYFRCPDCGFLQTEKPFWLEEAYEEPINISDTGYVTRNVYLSKKALALFYFLFDRGAHFLDYAAGYGMLTRLMRDYGLDYLWADPHVENLFAKGFEWKGEKIEAMTCFECFEHFADPLPEIEKMLRISKNIFFSTTLLPDTLPPLETWDYYGFEHGQHVAFYSRKSLEHIARKYSLNLLTNGANLHLFTEKPVSALAFKALLALGRLPIDMALKRMLGPKTTSDSRLLARQR